MGLQQAVEDAVSRLKEQGLYRQRVLAAAPDNELGSHFCSNDYLSLSQDPRMQKAFADGFRYYPTGSGGSALISGYHPIHRDLELTVARAMGAEDAMLFSSGYAANISLVMMLAGLGAHLFIDKSIHASIYDGIKTANAHYTRFLHNQVPDLARCLQKNNTPYPVVITEGIFSMSGQMAPLPHMAAICHAAQAFCVVDESHSFGVLGPHGLGAVAEHALSAQTVPLRVIGFGKAMGVQGALVVGAGAWIEALVQFARSYTYSTAVSPAMAYGLLQAFQFLYDADDRRLKLFERIAYCRERIKASSYSWADSHAPIQSLYLGCPHLSLKVGRILQDNQLFCQSIREPTVSRKHTGLRIVLNASHSFAEIDRLFSILESSCRV